MVRTGLRRATLSYTAIEVTVSELNRRPKVPLESIESIQNSRLAVGEHLMTLGDESNLLLKMLCHDLEVTTHLVAIGSPRPLELVLIGRPRPLELVFREERGPRLLELVLREERGPHPFELVFREDRVQARFDPLQPAIDAVEPCFDTIHRGDFRQGAEFESQPATTTIPSSVNRVKSFSS